MAFEVSLDGGKGVVLAEAGLVCAAAAKATVTFDMVNATSDLTYEAKAAGAAGNLITVRHVDPAGASKALAVSVVGGRHIVVSLATGSNSAITSTAAQVVSAIAAHAAAAALVLATDEGAGSGIVNATDQESLAGGVDALTLEQGAPFIVTDFDATNAKLTVFPDADRDFVEPANMVTVAVADLVTACTAP